MVQLIIFILGWPLNGQKFFIIFVPIFLPFANVGYFRRQSLFLCDACSAKPANFLPNTSNGNVSLLFEGRSKGQIELVDIFKGIPLPWDRNFLDGSALSISGNCTLAARLPVWRIHPIIASYW